MSEIKGKMKKSIYVFIVLGLVPLIALALTQGKETKCQKQIEKVMKRYVMVTPQEREAMYNDFGGCFQVPDTLDEFLQKMEDQGYASKNEFLGKITKPIEIIVDGDRKYKLITYKPIIDPKRNIATNYLNRILINEEDLNKRIDIIMKTGSSDRNLDNFSDMLSKSLYLSQKGSDNTETRNNLYSNIAQNYVQHELEHIRNHDEESDVKNETKAYLYSLARSPSYNTFFDLYWLTQKEIPIYTETANKIFKEFSDRGLPKEKIPETTLDEIKAIAGDIYRGI